MKYQVVESFFNFDKNGNPKPVSVGTEIAARVYIALTPQKQAKCKPVVKVSQPKLRFSSDELDLAIKLYNEFTKGDGTVVDNEEAIATLMELNPKRSAASVNMLFCQIRALDVYVSQEGLSSQSKALVRKLYEVNPARFPQYEIQAEKNLDTLLTQVRA